MRSTSTAPTFVRSTDQTTRRERYEQLSGNGLSQLGSGFFSTVYADPTDQNVVIKVGRYDSGQCLEVDTTDHPQDGWLEYVRCFGDHPSPHRPVVHSVELFRDHYVARMERLQPQGTHQIGMANPSYLPDSAGQFGAELVERFGADPTWHLDCHMHNVMTRADGTIVITDPICSSDHK